MRIEAYTNVQQIYKAQTLKKSERTNSPSFSDQVQISSLGKDIQTTKVALENTPDIRADITSNLKTSVEAGTYQVSSESFAQKLAEKYEEMR